MASSIFSAVKADEMTGATSSSPGVSGLVPAPAAGDEDKVLKGDGSWGDALDGMLRIVPFSIGVSSWTLSNGVYTSNFVSEFITTTSVEFVEYTDSFRSSVRGDLSWTKTPGGGGITFRTGIAPTGTLEGEIRVFDRDDGKTAIVVQQTALPTMRNVPFTVAVVDWSLNSSLYEAVFATAYVTATSHDFVEFDESIENATDGIKVEKAVSSGSVVGLKFTSRRVPAGVISGTVTPLDNADGKVAVVLQDTVMPIVNGGTGANTLAGAKENLGIVAIENAIFTLLDDLMLFDAISERKQISANIYKRSFIVENFTSDRATVSLPSDIVTNKIVHLHTLCYSYSQQSAVPMYAFANEDRFRITSEGTNIVIWKGTSYPSGASTIKINIYYTL